MKRLLITLAVCVAIISCNKDDDSSTPIDYEQKLEGSWHLNRIEIDNEMQHVEVCEVLTTIKFIEGGNFDIELFIGDEIENCQSATNTGTWAYIGDEKITIHLNGQSSETTYRISLHDNFNRLVLMQLENGEIIRFEEYLRLQ